MAEALDREATRHLRGAHTADSTLALATTLGETLARVHHALATPSPEVPEPLTVLDADATAQLDRRVKDVLSEAVVLTDPDVRETRTPTWSTCAARSPSWRPPPGRGCYLRCRSAASSSSSSMATGSSSIR